MVQSRLLTRCINKCVKGNLMSETGVTALPVNLLLIVFCCLLCLLPVFQDSNAGKTSVQLESP